ncbi:MAG: AIPR family protein [Bacteroidales bacterium]|nr:AIPR family protein [Bacteroidales bacterium]
MTIYEKIAEEIKADYYIQNYPNDGQRFVAWYLFNILKQDRNQTKDAITDGADDKQIDAIVIDDDKQTIYIIQGKYISNGQVDAEPLREVLSSWMQLRDLVRLQSVANQKLQRKLSEVAKAFEDEYEVCFELITTAKLTSSATKDLETFQKQLAEISENEDFDATISLVDEEELGRRHDLALETDNPQINYTLNLNDSKFMPVEIAGTQVVIAAIPLKEVVQIQGIKDGSLFQKNVRQSLGTSNAVNKKIRQTILGDKHKDFFFFHNGITAICNRMELNDNKLKLYGLSVVNGCQSLNTIQSCSETAKKLDDTFVLFRFYEIPQRDRADLISINTNSQSAVKPRDLRSNDKRVLNLKRLFEQKYSQGYFITKRGEVAPPDKDKNFLIDLSDLGKYLIAWHSQRPNISYGETKIFDKYFEILFKKDYKPENIQGLNNWMKEIMKNWTDKNPLGLNETLLTMKAYAPFHHLYAVSMIFAIGNNKSDRVPSPNSTWENAKANGMVDQIVKTTGRCLNTAMRVASNRNLPNNAIFSPQNWVKSKQSLNDINAAIEQYIDMLPTMEGGEQQYEKLKTTITIGQEQFEYRLQAE